MKTMPIVIDLPLSGGSGLHEDVDPYLSAFYSSAIDQEVIMVESDSPQNTDLARFDFWVSELVSACERLKQENLSLRRQKSELLTERAHLAERNSRATQHLETLITRLKMLEKV